MPLNSVEQISKFEYIWYNVSYTGNEDIHTKVHGIHLWATVKRKNGRMEILLKVYQSMMVYAFFYMDVCECSTLLNPN